MQPQMPIGRDSGGLNQAIINHPAAAAVFGLVIGIALIILTHLFALAGGIKPGADRGVLPPDEYRFKKLSCWGPSFFAG